MKLGSLFDGIGGWPLAAVKLGITPVWSSEIEAFPQEVTKKHFPNMKHLGDITKINGAEIEPVDIICMGSPCQDLSVAGKREGLDGERSGLFRTAIDIVRQMHRATGGKYPRFIVWENVPGAFSSNKGADFRTVLEEITTTEIPIPKSGHYNKNKEWCIDWANAGVVRSNSCEVAWRVLDAQYWGVPQRRKRIFLVTDFGKRRSREILFKPESMPRDFTEGSGKRKRTAGNATNSVTAAECYPLNTQVITRHKSLGRGTGFGAGKNGDPAYTLQAGHSHAVCAACFDTKSSIANSNPVLNEKTPLIKTNNRLGAAIWDMTHANEVMRPVKNGIVPTLNARMGTGGNQVPVIQEPYCIGNGQLDQAKLSDKVGALNCRHDQQAVLVIPINDKATRYKGGGASRRNDGSGNGLGIGTAGDPSPTLTSCDRHAVCAVDCRNLCENEMSAALQSKNQGGYSLNYQNPVRIGYKVRRLTPTECERLQGLPNGWTAGGSDSARYKAIGNGMAQPCADFVMKSILREITEED